MNLIDFGVGKAALHAAVVETVAARLSSRLWVDERVDEADRFDQRAIRCRCRLNRGR